MNQETSEKSLENIDLNFPDHLPDRQTEEKRSTETKALSLETSLGVGAVFVCDQPGRESILVNQIVSDPSEPGGYGQRTYMTTF
ncbi:hypothetical protein DY000_02016163 [Brassica cretica]|uniref:Uncharacterized protein n=1 Tax=Brassica cretica TaxID=69181 RepID=A0ABQ7D6T4_BRACR|nr:hypothetical protein DY000_02016163 [Brassica cretica]